MKIPTLNLNHLKQGIKTYPIEMLTLALFSFMLFVLGGEHEIITNHGAYWLYAPAFVGLIYLTQGSRLYRASFLIPLVGCAILYYLGDSYTLYLYSRQFATLSCITLIAMLSKDWQRENQHFLSGVVQVVFRMGLALLISIIAFILIAMLFGSLFYLFHIHDSVQEWILDRAIAYWFFMPQFCFLLLSAKAEQQSAVNLPKFWQIVVQFILSPALIAYTLLIYVYMVNIALAMELPHGGVAYIVLGYLSLGILCHSLQYLLDQAKWQRFYQFFSYLTLLPLSLLWFGIYERVSSYGFTVDRIYLIAICLGVSVFCLFLLWQKKLQYRLFSAMAVLLLTIVGFVWNPSTLAFDSQLVRFHQQLQKVNYLDAQGQIRTDIPLNVYWFDVLDIDKKQSDQLRELDHLLRELVLLDKEKLYARYGKETIEKMRDLGKKGDSDGSLLAREFFARLSEDEIDIKAYSKMAYKLTSQSYRSDIGAFIHNSNTGEESKIYQQAKERKAALDAIFVENGLEVGKAYSTEQLEKAVGKALTYQYKGDVLHIFHSVELKFYPPYGYFIVSTSDSWELAK